MPQFKEGQRACLCYVGDPRHAKGYGELHHYLQHSIERQAWNYGFHYQMEQMSLPPLEHPALTETTQ